MESCRQGKCVEGSRKVGYKPYFRVLFAQPQHHCCRQPSRHVASVRPDTRCGRLQVHVGWLERYRACQCAGVGAYSPAPLGLGHQADLSPHELVTFHQREDSIARQS